MQISKSRTTQELSRPWEDKNEDSRGLKRLYIGRNYVSKFRGKLFEDENLKTTKIEDFGPGRAIKCTQGICNNAYAPKAYWMRLKHA